MKNIASALLQVQKNLDPVHKGKKGYGYKYADLPAIFNAVIDELNSAGVVVLQCPVPAGANSAGIQTRLIHAGSGEEVTSIIEVPWEKSSNVNACQAYGMAITYGKRYALVAMLGVVTDDDDGKSAGEPKKKEEPQKPAMTNQQHADATNLLLAASTLNELAAAGDKIKAMGCEAGKDIGELYIQKHKELKNG